MRTKRHIVLVLFSSGLLFASCSWKINARRGAALHAKTNTEWGTGTRAVKVLYTGCGGLFISIGNTVFITDPYYTAHPLMKLRNRFGGIKPEIANTNSVLTTAIMHGIDYFKTAAVLVSHSHYDHLEDLPVLLKQDMMNQSAKIIGSPTSKCILEPFLKGHPFEDAESHAHQPTHKLDQNNGTWMVIDADTKVLPIQSNHAPHFYGGLHLWQCKPSPNCCPKPHQNVEGAELMLTKATNWKEGSTYSFLIDHIQNGDTFRIFIQTSSSQQPLGLPPKDLVKQHKINLAVICMASFKFVDDYPETLLSRLNADKTMIVHWENFMRAFVKGNVKSVRLTNPKKFYEKLKHIHQDTHSGKDATWETLKPLYKMPDPGVTITVKY